MTLDRSWRKNNLFNACLYTKGPRIRGQGSRAPGDTVSLEPLDPRTLLIITPEKVYAITSTFAWPIAHVLSLPFARVWLAFAPGGIDTMTVLAFALGLDPAFVAGQLIRLLGLSLVVPFLFKRATIEAQNRAKPPSR